MTALLLKYPQVEGRYLSSWELSALQSYVQDLPHRLMLYQGMVKKEKALIDAVMAKFQPTLPNLTQQHGPLAWQRCRRDLTLVWRYCTMAFLLNDEDYLRDKLLYWLETILKAYKMREQCHPAYRFLGDALVPVLGDEAGAAIRPYVMLAQTMLMG
ncbi:MAG: hypothetical protein Q6J68_04790 [Thermostichales cyanobacterium SZTDM-1c_bins_54]